MPEYSKLVIPLVFLCLVETIFGSGVHPPPHPFEGYRWNYSFPTDKDHDSDEPFQFQPRIASGRSVHVGDLPYHLQLRYMDTYLCGAALVLSQYNTQVVITAGQCITEKDSDKFLPTYLLSVVGGRILKNGYHTYEQFRGVAKIFRADDWTRTYSLYYNDVAVLHIDRPFTLDRLVNTIPLPWVHHTHPSGDIVIGGWGHTDIGESGLSEELQIATLKYVDLKKCKNEYDRLITAGIFDTNFCAGTPGSATYQGACRGDQGSPAAAVMNNRLYLAGVFNWGQPTCGNRYQPSIFMDISWYIYWIQEVSKDTPTGREYMSLGKKHHWDNATQTPILGSNLNDAAHLKKRSKRKRRLGHSKQENTSRHTNKG